MFKLEGIVVFCAFLIASLNIKAQSELRFERYTIEDGLVQNYIHCISQDNYGFMWFGTRNGMSRFDGIAFKNYSYNSNDSCSISLDWIRTIEFDKKNRLWIRSGGNLMNYNYEKECFTKHKLNLYEKDENSEERVFAVLYDSKGMLWTALSGQLVVFNPDTQETIEVPQNNTEKVSGIYVNVIYEDKKGFVWVGTGGGGLLKYDRTNRIFVSYKHDAKNSATISSNYIQCIKEDVMGNIWIGTDKEGGLNRYIPPSKEQGKGSFEKFFHDPRNPNSLSHNTVYSMCQDSESNLWIGTLNGLCLFERGSGKFERYYYDDRDPESLNDNIVRSLYCDRSGNLWVGTRLGVAKLKKDRFRTYGYSSYKSGPSHNKTDYLLVDATQNIFICTPVGIDYFDRENNTFSIFKSVKKDGSCLPASPMCMTRDTENKGYWIGTYNGGLSYYNIKTQKCVVYIFDNSDPASLGSNRVFSTYVDSKDTVWVSTWGAGVNVYNRETGEFKRVPRDFGNDSKAVCVYEDRDKNIWAGTAEGLYLFDKKTKRLKRYIISSKTDTSKGSGYISCLIQGEDRDLWVGTNTGLYRINIKTGESISYTIEDGLPSLKISSILEDKNNTIWISTNNGLVRFVPYLEKENKRKGLPLFKTYGKEDGLQSEFLERSSCKLNDGTVAFGGSKGLSIFHPDSIKEDTMAPQIAIIDFKVFNKSVKIGEEINGKVVLKQSVLTTDTIRIHYKNNNFTIGFAALHYRHSSLNQYAYKLVGYDNEWNYAQASNRYATYTDLPYSVYTFVVKASNCDGIWTEETKNLVIYVLPPWWLTLWFKILVVFVVVSAIISWFKLKTYKLRKQKKILEERVEHRTRQLKEANQILEESQEELRLQTEQLADMNKELLQTNTNLEVKTIEVENMAKQLHEADQSRLRFFANISHEFRTPLSLIIGPMEKYFGKQSDGWVRIKDSYFQLMYRNAKRLLRLINEVIDFRKMDQGEKKLTISNNNIEEFVKDVSEVFAVQAEHKNIAIETKYLNDKDRQNVKDFWFDADIMEKILYNLISNAIKYTVEGGNVSIQLSENSEQSTENSDQLPVTSNQLVDDNKLFILNSSLFIKVSDTGIGISKENLDKIFERFYRVETKESFTEEGVGIGLAYTKELVLLHEGNISVESELGKGSTFILQFPIRKEHFEKRTIGDKPTNVKLDYIHSMIDMSEKETNVSESIEIEEDSLDNEQDMEKTTILIVEDNKDLRKFIKEELEAQYKVLEAENGQEGWEIAFEKDPGIIVSDIMMPIMDGVTLCKKIKADENTSHIPVILLTAKAGNENTIEGLETGANDYITKPFDINVLKIKINNLFLLQKKLKEKFSQSINIDPSEITHSLIDEQFIQKAIKIVNENMHDYEFENDMFVTLMDSSRSVVYRKVKNLTGQSVSEFIRSLRLKAAAQYFLKGNLSVTDVCYKVGFKHPNVLTNYFTKMFGKSPTTFIKENLKINPSSPEELE